MSTGIRDSLTTPRRGAILMGLAALLCLIAVASALLEQRRLSGELLSEASALHRLASQRADQHDAHLTALSAVAVAENSARPDLFLDVASTITRFYPRIAAIDLVPLNAPRSYVTTRVALPDGTSDVIRDAVAESDGQLVLRAAPGTPGHYLVVKRSPNTDNPRYGLALEVDAAALLATESAFWSRPSVSLALSLPDGTMLAQSGPVAAPLFERMLGSASQPLRFQAGITPKLADLLPAGRLAGILVLATLLYTATMLGLRQMVRARRAEREALLSAQEARLAHASRVNALGEMASGIAHELTQPLAAILSQAQAGGHLARRGDADALTPVLNAIVEQARRASAILERLRNWTRPPTGARTTCAADAAVRNVEALLRAEAARSGITLVADLGPEALPVRADQVELEQILFNLVRNAMEAVAVGDRRLVTIRARRENGRAVIDVADTGPGVPPDLRTRLFEPFVTGKPGGTGLGLALCQRLAERMQGDLALLADGPDTVFRLRLPLAGQTAREAAA
ncbi:sensor histidine kinase [Defluviimonas sp. SAOS-178_SWC]|uniref:sensor histidine kinase n=1 Tax=Defluviimonas sp. SAOS-178_SWC TaxID=3121287 RepID=UPI0032216563